VIQSCCGPDRSSSDGGSPQCAIDSVDVEGMTSMTDTATPTSASGL
jgi:hypothetical protein